jgi:hypothetical protein
MSVTSTYAGLGVAVRETRTNDRGESTVPAEESIEITRRFASAGESLPVDEFVAGVLGQAHRAAYAHAAPDEARVILHLAHVFADELAKTDPRFDRPRFIEAALEEPA